MSNQHAPRGNSKNVLIAAFCLALAPAFAPADEPAPSPKAPPEGFTALFNGKDFAGWKGYYGGDSWNRQWRIEDSTLRALEPAPPGTPPASLRTVKDDYRDFVLRVEFRLPDKGSDSGILTRVGQINISPGWRGPVGLELDHRSEEWKKAQDALAASGLKDKDNRLGEWNQLEVRLVGQKVTVILNGKTVFDRFEVPKTPNQKDVGPIGLQKHPDKPDYKNKTDKTFPCRIEYRNVFVKELP